MLEEIKSIIQERFNETIALNSVSRNVYTLRLPLFLLTGDEITISITLKRDSLILTNGMYKNIEKEISKHTSVKDVLKDYILNEKRFKASIDVNLVEQGIEHSLNLKKIINNFNGLEKMDLTNIILQYAFTIVQHYGYIYHYALLHAKEHQKKSAFKEAMINFVKNFSDEYKIKDYENKNIVYPHEYYNSGKFVFSGVRSKNALHEVIEDISDLISEGDANEGAILLDFTKNKNLNKTYLNKIEKRLKKRNISYIIVEEEDFNELENKLKDLKNGA